LGIGFHACLGRNLKSEGVGDIYSTGVSCSSTVVDLVRGFFEEGAEEGVEVEAAGVLGGA